LRDNDLKNFKEERVLILKGKEPSPEFYGE
jgi:hypothetical protein